MKKYSIALLALAIIASLVYVTYMQGESQEVDEKLTVGAILPMSGATAMWGEQFSQGMRDAVTDLHLEDSVALIVENSQADAALGMSAFNKLDTVDTVDVVVSAFSSVSIPLKTLANERHIPTIMSLTSADNAVSPGDEYAFRVFHTASQTGTVHFEHIVKEGMKTVGVLYRNDEYGMSVQQAIGDAAAIRDVSVIAMSYLPGETDFRTTLTKLRDAEVDGLLVVTIPPIVLKNIMEQSNELDFDVPLIDVGGVASGVGARTTLSTHAEGLVTSATLFDLQAEAQDAGLTYAYSYGYDVVQLIHDAVADSDEEYTRESIRDALWDTQTLDGLNGTYNINGNDLNPMVQSGMIRDGVLTMTQ